MKFTDKQKEVYTYYLKEDPKILITSGAKRAGKTFVSTFMFLDHINKYRDLGLSFILAGVNQSTIRRNVLDDMELILGKELKLDMSNAVEVFGNRIYCFDGANSDSWKKVRGFTAAGAFLNEGTALHDDFIKEVISRCSHEGARIFIDTNPENPIHPVKTDYVDKSGQRLSSGQVNIKAFHFTLFDNTALNDEYVESITKATPSGMFTDRDIYGKWVSAEGVVYKDFDQVKHYITEDEARSYEYEKYFAGVDWGYDHYGSIVVLGKTVGGKYIVLEEHAHQHQEIDFWVEVAQGVKEKYGNILFYCDSARPEYIIKFRREGLSAVKADKSVLSGIEAVASLIKLDQLLVIETVERFKEEVNLYVWQKGADAPVKQFDDVLDCIRYAVYTEKQGRGEMRTVSKRRLGI